MASGCCGRGGCSCAVQGGDKIQVTGIGVSADPFIISADFDFQVVDNSTFNLTLTGAGTEASPYALQVAFAATAKVADFPDVSDTPPSNGQVLAYNTSTGLWTPSAPTTAASGSVTHDTSLTGDGSVGSPLAAAHATGRFTQTATGIGLTDDGINNQVRRFANAAARSAAVPAPALNTISALDSAPGLYDRWNGSAWVPAEALPVVIGGALLALSGTYSGGRVVRVVKQFSGTTDLGGNVQLLAGSDFVTPQGTAAGVLSAIVEPTGAVRFDHMVSAQPGFLRMTAYQPASSDVMASQAITATVVALYYL